MMSQLVRRTGTVRRFQKQRKFSPAGLQKWIDLDRLGGSAGNGQVLNSMTITGDTLGQQLFPLFGSAGFMPDWPGPKPAGRPPASIVCLIDQGALYGPANQPRCDLGIASRNLLPGAFQLEDRFTVLPVPIGYPAETVPAEVDSDGDVRYRRDDQGGHHMPKRRLPAIFMEPPVLQ